jgi:hypothetical protein
MFDKLKAEWCEFKAAPSGHRFVQCYERHQAREAPWLKPLMFFAAVFSLVIGVVLAFIPGPAILFFAIAGALLAAESRTVASAFDKFEEWGRARFSRLRMSRKTRDARATTKALTPQAAAIIAAKAEQAQAEKAKQEARLRTEPEAPKPQPEPAPTAPEQKSEPTQEQHAPAAPVDMSKLHVPFAAADYARGLEERDETAPQKPMAVVHATPIATVHTLPMQKMRKPVRVIEARDVGAGDHDSRTPRKPMQHVYGTVKLWTADMPKPQAAAQTSAPQPERPTAQTPAIVTLPPPRMVGERPKRTSVMGDRRATPPPAPRTGEHSPSRA